MMELSSNSHLSTRANAVDTVARWDGTFVWSIEAIFGNAFGRSPMYAALDKNVGSKIAPCFVCAQYTKYIKTIADSV